MSQENTNKNNVIQDIQNILGKADLWAVLRTDEQGYLHVHTDNETSFLALALCVFKDRPDLKEDLDMMLLFEAQKEKRAQQA